MQTISAKKKKNATNRFYLSAGRLFKRPTKAADVNIVAEQMEVCLPYETVTLNGMRSVINLDVIQSGLFIQLLFTITGLCAHKIQKEITSSLQKVHIFFSPFGLILRTSST